MLHTTFNLARKYGACLRDRLKVADALGSDEAAYGPDRPIPLSVVLEHTSLVSALWSLRCVLPEEVAARDRISRLCACDFAERVLPIYENVCPDAGMPREAIGLMRRFLAGEAGAEQLAHLYARSWDVAREASWDSAAFQAWAASRDACWSVTRYAALEAAYAAVQAVRASVGVFRYDVACAAGDAEVAEQTRIFLRRLEH